LTTGFDPAQVEIVRFAELSPVPWRDGGGVTREVAVGGSGGQDFDWRISIADVSVSGPFSIFPGVDRIITLVDGVRMDLVVDGVEHLLGLHESFSFDGASRSSCRLPSGPTRDLNIMTRRGRQSAALAILDLSETRPLNVAAGQVLVHLRGSAVVLEADGSRTSLRLLDALCPNGPAVREVLGSGRVAVVQIAKLPEAAGPKAGPDLQQGQQ
jgi:uncharacterized protein